MSNPLPPFQHCGWVSSVDGSCVHPKNITPECHAGACPITVTARGPFSAQVEICAPDLHAELDAQGYIFCHWCGKSLSL